MKNQTFYNALKELSVDFVPNSPMSEHTTFQIGGPAEFYIYVKNIDELVAVLSVCKEQEMPYMIVGNGSNLLVSDEGIGGAVIRLDGDFRKIEVQGENIKCGAGASLTKLCLEAQRHSLTGLEFAYGIPGTVGGAAYMNAGAYGGEMKDVVVYCTHLDKELNVSMFKAHELDLAYRHSAYMNDDYIILDVNFKLKTDDKDAIKARMEELMQKRKDKQPLELPSAGSTFKRPEGAFAAALIDECGLKGRAVGGAQVSTKHAGFVVNTGGATCKDVLDLVEIIRKEVKEKTGFELNREIIHI